MPAQYTQKGWARLVSRGLASGQPVAGFLSAKKSKKHDDCSSIIGAEYCDDLENKTQKQMSTLKGRAAIDPNAIIEMTSAGVLDGWERVERETLPTFSKVSRKRRAEIFQSNPGAWSTRLYNRKGKLYVHQGFPPAGLRLSNAIQMSEDWLRTGPRFKPQLFKNPLSIARGVAAGEIKSPKQADKPIGETMPNFQKPQQLAPMSAKPRPISEVVRSSVQPALAQPVLAGATAVEIPVTTAPATQYVAPQPAPDAKTRTVIKAAVLRALDPVRRDLAQLVELKANREQPSFAELSNYVGRSPERRPNANLPGYQVRSSYRGSLPDNSGPLTDSHHNGAGRGQVMRGLSPRDAVRRSMGLPSKPEEEPNPGANPAVVARSLGQRIAGAPTILSSIGGSVVRSAPNENLLPVKYAAMDGVNFPTEKARDIYDEAITVRSSTLPEQVK